MARKNLALRRFEIWEDVDGRPYANSPTGPISVDFALARKHLIPAEIMAEYWKASGDDPDVNLSRNPDAEPIPAILRRFAQTPNAF